MSAPAVKRTPRAERAVALFKWCRPHVDSCSECYWWWQATLMELLPVGEAVDLLDDAPVPDVLALEIDDD